MTGDRYDAIGDRYEDAFVLPVFAVVHRAFHTLAGDVHGLDVLDVATGSGVHARQWADAGARRVVSTDRSAEMIAFARSIDWTPLHEADPERAAPFTGEMAVNDPLVLFETSRP